MKTGEELERFLRERTGFKPGDRAVTCPNCGVEVKTLFCVGCGYEVTALNYDIMRLALQNGDITHDELVEGMRLIRGYDENTKVTSDLFPKILLGQKEILGG